MFHSFSQSRFLLSTAHSLSMFVYPFRRMCASLIVSSSGFIVVVAGIGSD